MTQNHDFSESDAVQIDLINRVNKRNCHTFVAMQVPAFCNTNYKLDA